MTFLPIQFWTKIKFSKNNSLNKSDILDKIENFLLEENFNYIIRKDKKIVFHKADLWTSSNLKSYLVSGTIKIKERDNEFIITNGNWMVFLIAIPFILIFFLSDSKFSTLDENDIRILKYFFTILFGGNLIIRFFAHLFLKFKIMELIKS